MCDRPSRCPAFPATPCHLTHGALHACLRIGTSNHFRSGRGEADEQLLLSRAFDSAGHGKPDHPGTRFGIGSVTKQFTALAVLMLQERRKLRVTDRACAHLPGCPPAWRAITLAPLLTHTSGLWDYAGVSGVHAKRFLARTGYREPTPEQPTEAFAGRPLRFPPGSRWEYSNSGYVLLGRGTISC